MSKWETGRGWPGVNSLKLIADEFSCTIDSLVSDEDVQLKRPYFAAVSCAVIAIVVMVAFVGVAGVVG